MIGCLTLCDYPGQVERSCKKDTGRCGGGTREAAFDVRIGRRKKMDSCRTRPLHSMVSDHSTSLNLFLGSTWGTFDISGAGFLLLYLTWDEYFFRTSGKESW